MDDQPVLTYGLEWNSEPPPPNDDCTFVALPATAQIVGGVARDAEGFWKLGFSEGNADTRAVDWWHPEVYQGGQSLSMIDSINLMYFAGHGNIDSNGLILASVDGNCCAWYNRMRLGVQNLKWLVLDLCDGVDENIDVLTTWWTPTRGDSAHPGQALHILCTFFGAEFPGPDTRRGADFVCAVNSETPFAKAWLDAAFDPGSNNHPIAIAPGSDCTDAANRLNNDTWKDVATGPVPSNCLSWIWRQ
jgi:Family of unknown function (DUF6345)